MRKKLMRTVFSVLVVVGAVLAVRWTIRAAMTRAYRAERDVGEADAFVMADLMNTEGVAMDGLASVRFLQVKAQ